MAATEIKALARIIGEIDYYQLLDLRRDAASGEVRRAYHRSSRTFHPDANRHLETELQDAVRVIAMRISEAYSVLRDPRRRQAYDRRLSSGDGVRMQLAEAQAEAGRLSTEGRGARTPQGRQFFKIAQRDIAREDWASAARNLQTAVTLEPGNAHLTDLLASVRQKLR